jgi:signal transduction histidine kinase
MMMTAPAVERGPTGPAELDVGRRPGHRSGLRAAAATAGALTSAAVVVITLVAIPRTDRFFAAHTATSPVAALADAAAGLSLVGLAVLASVLRWGQRDGRVTAAAIAAIAWVAPTWVAWVDAGPLARSVAMLVQPLLLAALMVLVLTVSPSIAPRRHRLISASVITLLGGIAVGRALVRDPFLDQYCWGNCQLNVLLVASRPGVARLLDTAWIVSTVAIGLALAGVAAWELTRRAPSARRLLGSVLLPAVAVGAAHTAYGTGLLLARPEQAGDPSFSLLYHARAWSVALFAVGSAMLVVRSWRAQQRMVRLVMELEDAPAAGTLGPALARATGDASLVVLYPSGDGDGYTDVAGEMAVLPPAGSRHAVTPIVHGGHEVALLLHEGAAVQTEQLRRALGRAGALALANERLHAELLGHLRQLRASRARVVEAGDQERRRLERNLHDGAQQQLLALTIQVQVARMRAETARADELSRVLRRAEEEARAAATELRELAHGIYPAVLPSSGLAAALRALAERAPLPVDVAAVPSGRLPDVVERVAYFSADEAVRAAHEDGSDGLVLRAVTLGERFVLELVGAGDREFAAVQDRVDAIGGDVVRSDGSLRVEVPCASSSPRTCS